MLKFSVLQERVSICFANGQFHLIFLNSAWYKNARNIPRIIYRLCRIQSLKLLDLNELKFSAMNYFPYCPTLH